MGPSITQSLQEYLAQRAKEEEAKKLEDKVGNELLRRAALLRVLDVRLYEGPLCTDLPSGTVPSFADFTRRAEFEALAAQPGNFIVRDTVRSALIERWRSDPALCSFSQLLVNYFQESSPLDAFTHKIFFDPAAALQQFYSLYAAADTRFDLVECDTLLRILRNRSNLLSPEFTAALTDREQYFRSRSLFADEWLRTVHFLERSAVTQKFQSFLDWSGEDGAGKDGSGKWLLRVQAAGGAGKTAYLRWLISRYCVPERGPDRTRIPVARVDLDFMHIHALAAQPWLVLIPIAEQLARQMASDAFSSFLSQWRMYAHLLQKPVSHAPAAPMPSFDSGRDQQAVDGFAIALGLDSALVVIDTFEEMLIHHSGAVAELLKHLAAIHQFCPGFKVAISGRQDLFAWREPLTGLPAVPPDDTSETGSSLLEIKPWDREECWRYLTEVRELRPAIPFESFPEPGGGNALKLSLFADLVGRGNSFTAADVRDLRRVEVEYLILRVIERIPESQCALRWLLRYAVLPRQLTRSFVEAVVAPQLSRAMNAVGPDTADSPYDNLPTGAEIVRRRRPWERCTQEFQSEREWPALLRYAGSATWVTLESGQPRLQPEVVSPMRYLLQAQPVAADIHAAAISYFERLAGDSEHDWAGMICEAVYHSFQLRGAAAESYWEKQLSRPQALDFRVRRQLAELLLSVDFLDDEHAPLPHASGQLLKPRTIAKATLELASLDAREALLSDRRSLLENASTRLETVRAIERSHGFHLAENGWRALVEAAVMSRTDHSRALEILDDALAAGHAPFYDAAFHFLKGNILQQDGLPHEAKVELQAAAVASKGDRSSIPTWRIQARLAALAFQSDDLAEATFQFECALQPANLDDIPDEDLGRLVESLIRMDRSSGNWAVAASRLRQFASSLERRLPSLFAQLNGELALDNYAPGLLLDRVKLIEFRSVIEREKSADLRLAGLALAQVGDFEGATSALGEFWKANLKSSPGAANEARFEQIQILLHDCRNYRAARSLLTGLRDLGEFAFLGSLLTMELDVLTGDERSARSNWNAIWKDFHASNPRKRARCLATALALGLEPPAKFDQLLDILAEIQPPGARIVLLRPFQSYRPKWETLTAGVSSRFTQTIPPPRSGSANFALQSLLLTDVLRYLGDRDSAATMLKTALEDTPHYKVVLRHQLVSALFRIGGILEPGLMSEHARDVLAVHESWPEFSAIALLELAEEWLRLDNSGQAFQLLDRVDRGSQPGTQYTMRFHVLEAKMQQDLGNLPAAAERYAQANEIAARLGIPERYIADDTPKPETALLAPHQIDIYVVAQNLMEVDFRPSRGSVITATFDIRRVPLFDAIQNFDWRSAYNDLSDRDALGAKLKSFLPIDEGLVEMAPGRAEDDGRPDGRMELRLAFSEADTLAALPWEIAGLDKFRVVYRGIRGVDSSLVRWQSYMRWLRSLGFPWESTTSKPGREVAAAIETLFPGDSTMPKLGRKEIAAIETLLRHAGEYVDVWDGIETRRRLARQRPRKVALIKLEQELERSSHVSYGRQGIFVKSLYEEKNVPVVSFDPRYLMQEQLRSLASDLEIFHFCLPLQEVNGLLQLGVPNSDSMGFMPSVFGEMAHRGVRPIVILDVPTPPRKEFHAQQLIWRNLFARQLFEHSSVEAVVCVGLAEESDSPLRSMIEEIAAHSPIGALAGMLNRRDPRMVAALYALDPDMPW